MGNQLQTAIDNKQAEQVKILLENGVDPNVANRNGGTPLMHAIMMNDRASFDLLLQHHADVNAKTLQCKYLISSKSNPDFKGGLRDEFSPPLPIEEYDHEDSAIIYHSVLMVAITYGRLDMVKALIQKQIEMDPYFGGKTVIEHAVQSKNIHLLALVLQTSAAQPGRNKALLHACEHGQTAMADLLLRHGANINYRDEFSRTPLHYAVTHQKVDTVKLLLRRNVDLTLKYSEWFWVTSQTIQEVAQSATYYKYRPEQVIEDAKRIVKLLQHPGNHLILHGMATFLRLSPSQGRQTDGVMAEAQAKNRDIARPR